MSADVRLQARNPAASFLVQAPAGSGKTELLTQRILQLLAVVDEPEEILALTFTRKAAAEMRGRVLEALNMDKPADTSSHRMQTWQLAHAAKKRSEARGWQLLRNPSRLRMMTLDSFTHALAGQMPLLSGFGEMPIPCSHPFPLYREAAEMAVNHLMRRAPDQAGKLLLHQDNNTPALVKLVADMLGKRDQWLRDVQQYASDTTGLRKLLEKNLREIMQQRLQLSAELMPTAAKAELPALIAFAGLQRGDDNLLDLHAWPVADLETLPIWQLLAHELMTESGFRKPRGINVKRGFPTAREFTAQKKKFQEILEELADIPGLEASLATLMQLPAEPCFDDEQWQILEALFALLLIADGQLQRQFEQRGEADFIEIALRAMRALEDEDGLPSDLLLKLDYRIRHILVDEFQDTSLLQIRLLQSLTTGWQDGDGADRSLFMVGDPMQSIYRFRKAEVGLFLLAALNRAGLPHVETLTLERNFRSAPAIVEWVNRAFADIFPDEADILQGAVEHTPAAAALNHPGIVRLHVQRSHEKKQTGEQFKADEQIEADEVVAAVQEQLRLPSASGNTQRIAILARSRKHLHAIVPALSAAGIRFRAIDILPLNKRPEIRQMRALLRALLHPADRESWAALLRGPCCGLSTKQMHALLADETRPLASILNDTARLEALDAQTVLRIRHLNSALAPCLQAAGRIGLRHLLATAWQRTGMAALMSEDAARNIDALLELVEELDAGGNIPFNLFDERLEKLYAAPDSSPQAAHVELLTMHGAKGLQWDVVILPGLGKRKGKTDAPLLAFTDIPVHGGAHPLLAARAAVRANDAIYKLIQGVENTRENNELARLLYVACTRAETALLMFGQVSKKKGLATSGSLLALLLPDGLEGDVFGAEMIEIEAEEGEAAARRHALTRIRSLPEVVEIALGIEPETSETIAEYFWAGPEAAPVGTVLHAALQNVAEKGVDAWQAQDSQRVQQMMERLLAMQGLSGKQLDSALAVAAGGLARALESRRGRWILSGLHREARCEWSLSQIGNGQGKTRIIDRSFIDDTGVRWIIDYKTGSHEGADLSEFLAEERQRYASQLNEYAKMVGLWEQYRYPIRLGLYFPLFDGWDEWAFERN